MCDGECSQGVTKATHWWMYEISVENEIRNAGSRIEYRWYAAEVTRFEAVWVAGVPPRQTSDCRIRVYHNDRLVGSYLSKAEAVGHVRKLIEDSPILCRSDFEEQAYMLYKSINGKA